jgi:hypothetical protein
MGNWLRRIPQDVWLRAVGLGLLAVAATPMLGLPARPAPPVAKAASPAHSAVLAAATTAPEPEAVQAERLASRYIAHAGGLYQGSVYTNSVAALQHSYEQGYRLMEVDLNLTTDNQVVLLHDWDRTVQMVYGITPGRRDLATFLADTQAARFRPATLDDLAVWLAVHPDVRVVLDTKVQVVDILGRVAASYPQLVPQFIPCVYAFEQYDPVSQLGFQHISLLIYRHGYPPQTLLEFAQTHPLYSLNIQPETFTDQLPELTKLTRVYCWTINNPYLADSLQRHGVYGVVTDALTPPEPTPLPTPAVAGLRPLSGVLAAVR